MNNKIKKNDYVIKIERYNIIASGQAIDYVAWWENNCRAKVTESFLENEEALEKALGRALPAEDLFLAKFMLNNAFFRDKDPFMHVTQMIFLKDNLTRVIEKNKDKNIIIDFGGKQKHNLARIEFVRGICKKYSNVKLKAGKSVKLYYFLYKNLRMKIAYPFALWAHYFAECVWSSFCRLVREKRALKNKIILSNYRHYAKKDEDNPFWANFTKLMKLNGNSDFEIIYYPSPTAISKSHYLTQLRDSNHFFFNNFLTFRDYFKNLGLYLRTRKKAPAKISYYYQGIDYGKTVKPLIDAFFHIFYPPFLKSKSAIIRLLQQNPRIIFTDSEMNLPAMQLGFLRGKTKLFVMSNEVICDTYAALPVREKSNRPSFDLKFVYNEDAKKVLVEHFNYPASKMAIMPDPRFLEGAFNKRKTEEKILFISQMCKFFYSFTNSFKRLIKKTTLASKFELVFKPHPHEPVNPEKFIDKDITYLKEKKLSFTPKYAVNASSTLGLELLFQGSIVFFLDKVEFGIGKYFGIAQGLPFLVCYTEKDVLKKIEMLENDQALYNKTRQDIARFLKKEYGIEELDVLLKRFKAYIRP